MNQKYHLRPAEHHDHLALSALINFEFYVHRHLDWRAPLEWLGCQPFWLIEDERQVLSTLAMPADPPGVAWIRLFAVSGMADLNSTWHALITQVIECFEHEPQTILAAVALQGWFARLLQQSGFNHKQDIVVLSWDEQPLPQQAPARNLPIRVMRIEDLPGVQSLDADSFDALWRLSLDGLERAFQQSTYATVVLDGNEIVGYQVSSSTDYSAHLARLAVHPRLQKQGIGSQIVANLLKHYVQRGISHITVNTQSDNHSSLALYDHLGFQKTSEQIPVFVYQRPPDD